MPNPIKYSTGSESLALKKGNFYIGTGDVGKGPTSTTGYYDGINPPSGGYTIYLNKETGGPSIYTCSNDTELIGLTNAIAGQSYTTANECLTYFAGQTDKLCVNRDYEGIVTDGLILNLDAGFTPSYPKNGTTWYDVGGTNNGTLTNGPTFNSSSGGSIVFDVSDYFVIINDSNTLNITGNQITVSTWVKHTTTSAYQGLLVKDEVSSNSKGFNLFISSPGTGTKSRWGVSTSVGGFGYIFGQNSISPNTWYNIVGVYDGSNIYIYENGTLQTSQSKTGNIISSNGLPLYIGNRGPTKEWLEGNMSSTQIYNKALSATEILQNYNAQKGRFGL